MEKENNILKNKKNQILASVLPGVNESPSFIVP